MLKTWDGKRIKANGFKTIHAVKAQFRKAGHVPGLVKDLVNREDGDFHWLCSCGQKLIFRKEGKRFNNLMVL